MAEYYIDHGAYPAYSATPTWLQCQEGDGKNGTGAVLTANLNAGAVSSVTVTNGGSGYSANTKVFFSGGGGSGATGTLVVNDSGTITSVTIGAGGSGYGSAPTISLVPGLAACAEAKVSFSGIPTTGSITVMGATVSTTGVIGAASAAAAASALATNINATTNTISSSVSATTPQLRDFVYAEASGSDCKIMTRVGSYSYNTDINSFADVTESLDNCTRIAFGDTGNSMQRGRSGVYGYIWNDFDIGTIWKSAWAVRAYGTLFTTLAGPVPQYSDLYYARGNGKEVKITATSEGTTTLTISVAMRLLIDDGTIWIGDSSTTPNMTWSANSNNTNANTLLLGGANERFLLSGTRRKGLKITRTAGTTNGLNIGSGNSTSVIYRHVDFIAKNSVQTTLVTSTGFAAANGPKYLEFKDCDLTYEYDGWLSMSLMHASYTQNIYVIDGLIINAQLYTGSPSHFINSIQGGGEIYFRNCKCITGTGAKPRVFGSYSPTGTEAGQPRLFIENVEGFDLTTTLIGWMGSMGTSFKDTNGFLLAHNVGPDREFRHETHYGVIDWLANEGYPTLDSYLPSGTAWSYRFLWNNATNAFGLGPTQSYCILNLSKTFLETASAVQITLEILVDDAIDHLILDDMLSLQVSYIDNASNIPKGYSSLDLLKTPVAIASSSANWTKNSYTGYVARKLTFTTPTSVKKDTEIEVQLKVSGIAPGGGVQTLFVNPSIGLTSV